MERKAAETARMGCAMRRAIKAAPEAAPVRPPTIIVRMMLVGIRLKRSIEGADRGLWQQPVEQQELE
jgi:hypothetical protein